MFTKQCFVRPLAWAMIGPLAARAVKEGYGQRIPTDKLAPYHGYDYRILSGQGKGAPGGAYGYVVKGKMIGGFALLPISPRTAIPV